MPPSRRNGLTRRALVAATVLGAGGSALAQRPPQPPRVKGPLVWLDMDQQDLDDAYDQLVYAPNRDYILKRCARNSELARERLGAPQRFAYGATPMEALDVFTAKVSNAPVSVFVKGGVCGSGMYDLKPVRLSKRSSYVKFTDAIEDNLSPQRHLELLAAPVALVHGTLETPEFQRQSRDFAAAVKAAGKPVTLAVMESYNHFEVMEQLGNPYSLFGRAVLEQMQLVR